MIHTENDAPSCTTCSLDFFCSYYKKTGLKPRRRHLKRKETLHLAHDLFTNIYAIERGALKTHETDPAGNELIRGFYLKNEVYGYDAIYKGNHPFTSTALTETVVCEISYPHFIDLIRAEPAILTRILYLMSQQLTMGSYLKYMTAQQKLSAFLLDLSMRLSTDESPSDFLLPMSYQDIGHYLVLATETISRILSQFKNKQMISIKNKQVYFIKPDELKNISDGFSI